MKLTPLGSNQTEIELTALITVLFSYKTPVAARIVDIETGVARYVRTAYKWSVTTSKHINQWLDGRTADIVDQQFLDDIVEPK